MGVFRIQESDFAGFAVEDEEEDFVDEPESEDFDESFFSGFEEDSDALESADAAFL